MIKIFGPENPARTCVPNSDGSGFHAEEGKAVETPAPTLGAALKAYEKEFAVSIEPYDGSLPTVPFHPDEPPKYFFYDDNRTGPRLVDVHIQRGSHDICPKQDLQFQLLKGDIIHIGALVC